MWARGSVTTILRLPYDGTLILQYLRNTTAIRGVTVNRQIVPIDLSSILKHVILEKWAQHFYKESILSGISSAR